MNLRRNCFSSTPSRYFGAHFPQFPFPKLRISSMKLALCVFLFACSAFGQSVADKKFWTATGIDYSATFADAMTSAKTYRLGVMVPARCGPELNPIYGRNPKPNRIYAQMFATTTVVTVADYFLKRHHVRIWPAGALTEGTMHAIGAAQNAHNCL